MAGSDGRAPSEAPALTRAVAEAYQNAAGLSDYFGRILEEVRTGASVPNANDLLEAEAMVAALEAIVRELPRLVPGWAERMKQRETERDEAAGG